MPYNPIAIQIGSIFKLGAQKSNVIASYTKFIKNNETTTDITVGFDQ
jgi:hypothetical protein